MNPVPVSRLKALIVDDDPWSMRLLRGMLKECFPMLDVETRATPVVEAGYHIYLLDNDFSGSPCAVSLARQVRLLAPDALVIAFSGQLDRTTLVDLLNAGCDGACDKGRLTEMPGVMAVIQRYCESLVVAQNGRSRGSLREAARAVADLIREWNTRLDNEERRHVTQY